MTDYTPDDVDKGILSMLQENARYTATEIAEAVGVSDNTVHNRMARLEDAGVIEGYAATVDYEPVGLGLYFHFACTARIGEREKVAQRAMEIPEVVEVTELATGDRNLHIKVLCATDEDLTAIARRIDEFSLEINDENLIRAERPKPVDLDAVDIQGETA